MNPPAHQISEAKASIQHAAETSHAGRELDPSTNTVRCTHIDCTWTYSPHQGAPEPRTYDPTIIDPLRAQIEAQITALETQQISIELQLEAAKAAHLRLLQLAHEIPDDDDQAIAQRIIGIRERLGYTPPDPDLEADSIDDAIREAEETGTINPNETHQESVDRIVRKRHQALQRLANPTTPS